MITATITIPDRQCYHSTVLAEERWMWMVCCVAKPIHYLCPLTLMAGPIQNRTNNKQFRLSLSSSLHRAREQHATGYSICYFYACDVKGFNRTPALFTIQTDKCPGRLSLSLLHALSLSLLLSLVYLY